MVLFHKGSELRVVIDDDASMYGGSMGPQDAHWGKSKRACFALARRPRRPLTSDFDLPEPLVSPEPLRTPPHTHPCLYLPPFFLVHLPHPLSPAKQAAMTKPYCDKNLFPYPCYTVAADRRVGCGAISVYHGRVSFVAGQL
jgi:hypothetical protein